MTLDALEVVHGSESTYFNYSCRCSACYEEHSRAEALRHKRRKAAAPAHSRSEA